MKLKKPTNFLAVLVLAISIFAAEIHANIMTEETNTPTASAQKTDKNLYPLDWKTSEVKLAKGRFVHVLSHPDDDLIFEREKELAVEIPIGKDGSYALPDDTAQEETDAKYYDRLVQETRGYDGREVPALHKAKAFQGLFTSEIYVDEGFDVFDEEITVIEEIGDEPDFVVKHRLKMPSEQDLKKVRRVINSGKLVPDRRGRQRFVTQSNLRKLTGFYDEFIVEVEGACLKYSEGRDFSAHVSPLVKRKVVSEMVAAITKNLSD